jgi:hypothetical protein
MEYENDGDFYLIRKTPGILFERATKTIEKGVEF